LTDDGTQPDEQEPAHYHLGSKIETAFNVTTRKFGDNVRSGSDVAKVNEALAKLVCHNICCVIISQCELEIEPIFWQNSELHERVSVHCVRLRHAVPSAAFTLWQNDRMPRLNEVDAHHCPPGPRPAEPDVSRSGLTGPT
jgi:hypothetical protein